MRDSEKEILSGGDGLVSSEFHTCLGSALPGRFTDRRSETFLASPQVLLSTTDLCDSFGFGQPGQCSDRCLSPCEGSGCEDPPVEQIHTYTQKPQTEQSCLSWRSDTFSYLFPSPHPRSPFLFPSCNTVPEREPKWQFTWITRLKDLHFTSHK